MVANCTVHSFVIIHCVNRVEIHDYSCVRLSCNYPLRFRETEYVTRLVEKLKLSRQIRIVVYSKHSTHHLSQSIQLDILILIYNSLINFIIKPVLLVINIIGGKINVKRSGIPHTLKCYFIASNLGNFEMFNRMHIGHNRTKTIN